MFHAYNSADICKILDSIDDYMIKSHKNWYYTKPRARALVMVLASSGISLHELKQIKIKDLEQIENIYCFHLKDSIAFCSSETKVALDDYLSLRNIEPDSLLFDLNYDAMRKIIYRLVKKSQITKEIQHESWDGTFQNKLETPGMIGMQLRFSNAVNLNPSHTKQQQFIQYKEQINVLGLGIV